MRRSLVTILILSAMAVITFMSSCEKDYFIPVKSIIPDSVSFSANVIPVFDKSCNSSGCHNTGGIAPDLTAENAYNDLILYQMVDTLNPAGSILYTRMISAGNPMPPSGILKGGEDQLILKWIEQGARNN